MENGNVHKHKSFRDHFEFVLFIFDAMIYCIFATFSFLNIFPSTRSDL